MDERTLTRIEAQLAELWQRNLPLLRTRLDLLDRTAASSAAGTLTQTDRDEARETAHKLAGSLGTFGYPQGTDYARQIELLLTTPTQPDLTLLTTQLRESLFPTK
jgi:HPt (histidine-containing phosphotransfer) domain-containing protein